MTTGKLAKILLGAALMTGTIIQAQAQDKKADPTGTYIWTQAGRNGGPDRTNTLTLKLDGDKLTWRTPPQVGSRSVAAGTFRGKTVTEFVMEREK